MLVDILTNLLSVDCALLSSVSDARKSTYFGRPRVKTQALYAAELRPRAKPGYVHSLGCDLVKFSQDLGRANHTLASTQNRCLFASKPTSPPLSVLSLSKRIRPVLNGTWKLKLLI